MVEPPQFWPENPISPVTQYLKPDQFGESKYLNNVTRFDTVTHIYTQTKQKEHNDKTFNGSKVLYSIYLAYENNKHPPYIILDKQNHVERSPRDLALRYISDPTEIRETTFRLPKYVHKTLEKVLEKHGYYIPDNDEDWSLIDEIYKARICLKPVPKLKNPTCLKKFDWPRFTQLLAKWEFDRDPRVVLVQQSHLLRGIEPRLNPHGVLITNGGTGKSSFYKTTVGKVFDKVTRNSLLGYARGPEEINPGTMDGMELPVAIDQIESGEWGVLDTVFNLMEFGEASISSGSVEITIKSKAPVALLGNVTDHSSAEKGMESILNHLTANPTIGRRIGPILYGENYKTIEGRSSKQSWYEWEKNAQFYRAVEEAALPRLEALYKNENLWTWISRPIPGYSEAVKNIAESMEPGLVKRFCLEHGYNAHSRLRSAALNVSLVEHMDLIALKEHNLEMILDHADELLQEFIAINLESIRNLVENAAAEIKHAAEAYYHNQPEYVRIIIEAVEYARRFYRQKSEPSNTFYLNSLDYKPDSETYTHLSRCKHNLLKKKRGKARLNKRLKEFFGFTFEPKDNDLLIVLDPEFHGTLGFIKTGLYESDENHENDEIDEKNEQEDDEISSVSSPSSISSVSQTPEVMKKREDSSVLSRFDKKNIIMASLYQANPSGQWSTEEIHSLLKYKWGDLPILLDQLKDENLIYHRLDTWRLTGSGKRAAQEALANGGAEQ